MAKGRKTVEVRKVLSRANGMMAAPSPTPEFRKGVYQLLEDILFQTDNYNGFDYVKPGGNRVSREDIWKGNYDETRRRYYGPKQY